MHSISRRRFVRTLAGAAIPDGCAMESFRGTPLISPALLDMRRSENYICAA